MTSKAMHLSYSLQTFATLRAINISSLEAIRAEMEKNIEGDEYLDYSDQTLERQRNVRAVSLDHVDL